MGSSRSLAVLEIFESWSFFCIACIRWPIECTCEALSEGLTPPGGMRKGGADALVDPGTTEVRTVDSRGRAGSIAVGTWTRLVWRVDVDADADADADDVVEDAVDAGGAGESMGAGAGVDAGAGAGAGIGAGEGMGVDAGEGIGAGKGMGAGEGIGGSVRFVFV